jgi:hypothetical protein
MKEENVKVSKLNTIYDREKKIIYSFEQQKTNGFLGIKEPDLVKDSEIVLDNDQNKNELIAYLQATKNVYEFKSSVYQENTNATLTRIVFLAGIIISFIGLSIFNDIFDFGSIPTDNDGFSYQLFFYRLSDIIVTGGLLGGGSKSFNVFIETLNKSMERVKDPKGTD